MSQTHDQIRSLVGTQRKARFTRWNQEACRVFGYVLAASDTLVLIHSFEDFRPDGYRVLRVKDITEVRTNSHEAIWDRMLAAEGLLDDLHEAPSVDLAGIGTAIDTAHAAYGRMILERDLEDASAMRIGSLVNRSSGVVWFDSFDNLGEWEPTPLEIDERDVTGVQIESPYLRRWWRHLAAQPPNASGRPIPIVGGAGAQRPVILDAEQGLRAAKVTGRLAEAMERCRYVSVRRDRLAGHTLDGFVVGLSQSLALIHQIVAFDPDGYSVVRVRDIREVAAGPEERLWEWMLGRDHALGGLDSPPSVDLSSMGRAIDSIGRLAGQLIIECEEDELEIEDFYIGRVVALTNRAARFAHFDSAGAWSEEPAKVSLDEITRVQFATQYVEIFSRYVGDPPH